MANTPSLAMPPWMSNLSRYRPLLVPIAFIGMLSMVVVPIPPVLMDLMISANIALAVIILLTTIFVESPLDFSVFPSLLLGTTLFRLVLNIATTKMILSADPGSPQAATAAAGRVIQAFSEFVTGSSVVVGVVMFSILIIIQFVVITKGATRISEVAARFTLDGMPGKQMAIDADLNAGLIDEQAAKDRREQIAQEADFYGAMDGAAKFVRGDAIAGIIITAINILGGFAIGVFMNGWTVSESVDVFTRLTVGDGLVSQLPAFVISIAAGLIVTRSSSRSDLGTELTDQLTSRAAAVGITAGFLILLGLATPLPTMPMLILGTGLGLMVFFGQRSQTQAAAQVKADAADQAARPDQSPVEEVMKVDTLELEVGYGLVRLVDHTQGGDLLNRITMIRRQLASEIGLVMPPVRIRDNMQLQPNDYRIKVRGNELAEGQLHPGQYLAMDSGLASEPLQGVRTVEPAFGLEAVWINPGQKERAEALNYTVVGATDVLATHITEVVRNHARELLTREETNNLIVQLKERAPKLCEEVLVGQGEKPPLVKPGELQRVLQNLLSERVPVRDLEVIVETLGDWAPRTRDLEVLTEYVRNALRRTICNLYTVSEPVGDGVTPGSNPGQMMNKLYCVSLDPALEDQVNGYIERSNEGTSMTMPPAVANRITTSLLRELQGLIQSGHHPVVLASPQVRGQIRQLIEPHLPNAAVLGYNEVSKGVEVEAVGLVQVNESAELPSEMLQGAVN